MTKKLILAMGMLCLFSGSLRAQNKEYVAYTVFYNVVLDDFKYPLIGFVNVAKGNHSGLRLGFANTVVKDATGSNIGFVNNVIGNNTGASLGFINNTIKDNKGAQLGFVNTSIGQMKGAQWGFVNVARKNSYGAQIGFVNNAIGTLTGTQIGFANVAKEVKGGIPIGILSVVKNGGYRAVELSANAFYPYNLAFKTGVPKFYTYFQASYNDTFSEEWGYGAGIGSMVKMKERLYFNPELGIINSSKNTTTATHLNASFKYSVHPKVQVSVGPTVSWVNFEKDKNVFCDGFLDPINRKIDDRNRLVAGAQIGINYHFTSL